MTEKSVEKVCQACFGQGFYKRYELEDSVWQQTCGVCGGDGRA